MKHVWIGAAVLAGAALLWRQHPKPPVPMVAATQNPHTVRRAVSESPAFIVVYVAGAVKRPALYRLPPGARAADAVRTAGGFRSDADQAATNLAERLTDGLEVRVYAKGENARSRSVRASSRTRARKALTVATVVDINTADAQTLAALPGIGATLAQRIVAFREINGAFGSVDELLDVAGMTQRRLDLLAPYLQVHGAR